MPVFAAHATPQMALLIAELNSANDSKKRTMRRMIRNRLFKIREGINVEKHDQGLKSWFELQFNDDYAWDDFTFKWDVSVNEPLKLITPFEWDGNVVDGRCDPSAFTHQQKLNE